MGYSSTRPPSEWIDGVVDAGGGTYYLSGATLEDVIVWHLCSKPAPVPRWLGQGVGNHTLVALEPLHLEPSLACADGCPWHGWIRGGRWASV